MKLNKFNLDVTVDGGWFRDESVKRYLTRGGGWFREGDGLGGAR